MDLAGLFVSKHKQERKDTFFSFLSLPHTLDLFFCLSARFFLCCCTHTQGHARTHNGHSVDPCKTDSEAGIVSLQKNDDQCRDHFFVFGGDEKKMTYLQQEECIAQK